VLSALGSSGTFTIENNAGTLAFTCTNPSHGGCPTGGNWSS
jgi:hypothetical protein